jgi:hypothetical protein
VLLMQGTWFCYTEDSPQSLDVVKKRPLLCARDAAAGRMWLNRGAPPARPAIKRNYDW